MDFILDRAGGCAHCPPLVSNDYPIGSVELVISYWPLYRGPDQRNAKCVLFLHAQVQRRIAWHRRLFRQDEKPIPFKFPLR